MNAIRQLREASGLKQTELAEKLEISTVTLSRYETGRRSPRAEELVKMARLFGCSVDDLLSKGDAEGGAEALAARGERVREVE